MKRHRVWSCLGVGLSLWAGGCATETPAPKPQSQPEVSAHGVVPEAPPKTPPPSPSVVTEIPASGAGSGFRVHEWGLIQFSVMGTEVASSGHGHLVPTSPVRPPMPDPDPMPVKKPLIYFHPEPGFDPATAITVTVKMPAGGRVREVWPTPGNGPQPSHFDQYTWPSVRIQPDTACGPEGAPKSVSDPPCASLGSGVCEAHEMRDYLRPAPHCLDVAGQKAPVLLYNGTMPADVPPLKVDTAAGTVKNTLSYPMGPVFVRWKGKVLEVESLAPGEVVTLSEGAADMGPSVIKRLSVILVEKGLTDAESLSFIEAWRPDILKEPFAWKALGILSQEAVDAMIPLTFFPAPRGVSRVLAFTVE